MPDMQVTSVTKDIGETFILKGVTLYVKDGEFSSLVGPSGCGKSTLLRVIAGLETPTSGTISIGRKDVIQPRAADRNLSMEYQSYALYPHLTVAENIAVPVQMRQMTALQRLPEVGGVMPGARAQKDDIAQAVRHAAEKLEIGALTDHKPEQLSGGQRQRVALGHAVVRDPMAFLLYKPLSHLDAKLGKAFITVMKLDVCSSKGDSKTSCYTEMFSFSPKGKIIKIIEKNHSFLLRPLH
jgi:multiple sugar transport system ATP-binding protein